MVPGLTGPPPSDEAGSLAQRLPPEVNGAALRHPTDRSISRAGLGSERNTVWLPVRESAGPFHVRPVAGLVGSPRAALRPGRAVVRCPAPA